MKETLKSHSKIYYPAPDLILNSIIALAFKCIKIFLVVVFSMLFGRHNKFPTSIKVIVPFVDVQVLHQALNCSSWRLSIEVVLQHKSFFIAAFCCLPRTECTIFVQRDHCYLLITTATAVQSDNSENNGTILCSHYFLFQQFFLLQTLSNSWFVPCFSA